jgi:hypothetical protein
MKIIKNFLVAACVATLLGCSTTHNYSVAVKSWRGASTVALFDIWGYPNRIMKLPNGNNLYIYREEQKGEIAPTILPSYSTVTKRGNQTVVSSTPSIITGGTRFNMKCTTWFEVNRKNRIVGTSFRGNNCVADEQFLKKYSHD